MADSKTEKYNSLSQPAESKQQLAYQQLKADILNNTYPEGTVMVERKLCEIYNVSRSPIRNALQQLTHEGLLTFLPGKGVVVASFTTEDILEVYELIEVLQNYAISACIDKNSPMLIESLQMILDHMDSSLRNGNVAENKEWDSKFHEAIIEYSGNSRLRTIFDQLQTQNKRFMTTSISDETLAEQSREEHRVILEAIQNRDKAAAQEAISRHYSSIRRYYVNKLLNRIHL